MDTTAHAPGDPAWPDDAVEVGRILGPWGVKGALKVLPYASDPKALFSSRRWFIEPGHRLLKITGAREQGDAVVATAQEVPDRNAAEALKGAQVFVSRSSFPTPDDDEYYWVDLIGLEVVNREGVQLGVVSDLLSTGPHSVLKVRPAGVPDDTEAEASERLIPFVDAYVDQVDLPARRITVDWGLDY
ncbi:ribosome maturation factor RimM [Aquincola sp. J276]|uniref:ribosome maturation factor RimM n=1 Tax=Aquincola sp. J276 TaxID=2898432 RepID=UPI002150FA10|nr:ribosome maturation factor RimM [Aquincola sp. J276]MCR5863964.1 ribosome maturation factor RimM [Aquincola sp. J276]